MTAEGYYDDSFDDGPSHEQIDASRTAQDLPPLYTQEYLAAFPKKYPHDDMKPVRAGCQLAPHTLPPFEPRMHYDTTPPPNTPRAELLREAEQLITGDRNETYGTPTQNFSNIASLWDVQLRHKLKDAEKITPADVAQLMIHVKMARMIAQPKRDSYLDIAGYAACGWEVQANES